MFCRFGKTDTAILRKKTIGLLWLITLICFFVLLNYHRKMVKLISRLDKAGVCGEVMCNFGIELVSH